MSNTTLVPCPICNSLNNFYEVKNTDHDLHIGKYGDLYKGMAKSKWQVCVACGFVHQNPRPSAAALNQFYLDSKYHPATIPEYWQSPESYLAFAQWYYQEKIDYALKHSSLKYGNVFEVGFGQGGALKLFEKGQWQVYGVEVDKTLFSYARNKLGLSSIREGLLDRKINIETKVDLVFSNHTFEHIADLHDAMIGIQKVLKPGGYVFTAVPTYYKNRSRLSLEWLNCGHYSMFTHKSLNHLFSQYGLEEVTHTYRGWRKEIDDLWHLARFTGRVTDPKVFHENPDKVRTYVNKINPINSIIWYPIYSNYASRVQAYESIKREIKRHPSIYYLKMLLGSPQVFVLKAAQRVKRKLSAVP